MQYVVIVERHGCKVRVYGPLSVDAAKALAKGAAKAAAKAGTEVCVRVRELRSPEKIYV